MFRSILRHFKNIKGWVASWQNQQSGMCSQRRLTSAWASDWRSTEPLATHWAHSEGSDQTRLMPRLIWVFAGRTDNFVGFVVLRLIWLLSPGMAKPKSRATLTQINVILSAQRSPY